jgi:hypothetical protein
MTELKEFNIARKIQTSKNQSFSVKKQHKKGTKNGRYYCVGIGGSFRHILSGICDVGLPCLGWLFHRALLQVEF